MLLYSLKLTHALADAPDEVAGTVCAEVRDETSGAWTSIYPRISPAGKLVVCRSR